MRGHTRRALSRVPVAELPTPTNGQESVAKLVYAPLAFLSFRTETTTLAGILASAVAFLEGYSADEMETDLEIMAKDDASVIARSHLRLVPYRSAPPALKPASATLIPHESVLDAPRAFTGKQAKTVYHEVSLSTVRSSTEAFSHHSDGNVLSPHDAQIFEQYKNTFRTAPLFCDSATQTVLETTSSPELARAVFRCFAEAGLVAPPEVMMRMLQRIDLADETFLQAVVTQLEAECDLGVLHMPTQVIEMPRPPASAQQSQLAGTAHPPRTRHSKFDTARATRLRK